VKTTVDPAVAVAAVVRAVAHAPQTTGLFAESSTAMFYVTQAVGQLDSTPYCRFSTHYGSMGHAIAGAVGFCVATGMRAVVVTGDGSFDLMNPMRIAVKHRLALTMVVLNDARLGLPYYGTGRLGASHAQATTQLPPWDFTRQGSRQIGGLRVFDAAELDAALSTALSCDGCYIVDVLIDPAVQPPVGARLEGADALFDDEGAPGACGTDLAGR
jgi:thiamine pyrophosphate-dependent acetolactate synthase large subunit-like protein